MKNLPTFQTKDLVVGQIQTTWPTALNPILQNPICNGILLNQVALTTGSNTVNHKLGRKLLGWIVVGIDAAATIYDQQSTNIRSDKTLILNSSAPCNVTLYVF